MAAHCRLALVWICLPTLLWAGEGGPAPPFEGEIVGERVYVRGGDGINYTVLTIAEQGDRVSVRGKRFSWYAILVPRGCTVWVHKSMLDVAPDGKQGTLAKDRVNVRARAALKGDILGQLPRGAKVAVVDQDGEWAGIAPPTQARAWVHSRFIRRVGDAVEPKPSTARPPVPVKDALDRDAGLALLGQAHKAYLSELAKKPDERKFDDVLSIYQKVAAKCTAAAVAQRAEQARQRLLKIVDLHQTLRGLREPLKQFEQKYDALEKQYKQRANPPAEPKK